MKKGCGIEHGTAEKFFKAHPKPVQEKANLAEDNEDLPLEEYDKNFHVPPEVAAKFGLVARAFVSASSDFDNWLIDSGCNTPLTNKHVLIHNPQQPSHPGIRVADDRKMDVTHVGTSRVQVIVNGQTTPVDCQNMHLVPGAGCNLLSLFQMLKGGRYGVFLLRKGWRF